MIIIYLLFYADYIFWKILLIETILYNIYTINDLFLSWISFLIYYFASEKKPRNLSTLLYELFMLLFVI